MKKNEIAECVVVVNGVFCECGGLMMSEGGRLLYNPTKQKVACPFCGDFGYVETPYTVDVQFKKVGK